MLWLVVERYERVESIVMGDVDRLRAAGWYRLVHGITGACGGWVSPDSHKQLDGMHVIVPVYTTSQAVAMLPTPESRLRDALLAIKDWRERCHVISPPQMVDAALNSVRDLL